MSPLAVLDVAQGPFVDSGQQKTNVRHPNSGAWGDVVIVNDGATDGSTANLNCNVSSPFRGSLDPGKTVLVNAPAAASSRGDTCGTTSGSATVTDVSAVAGDVGKCVAGPGIPVGAWIISVVASTSFTLSAPASATAASVTLAVSFPLVTTVSSVNSGSQIVLAGSVATQGGALTGLTVQFGHDDTAAMQAAINAWGTNYAALKKTGWSAFATLTPEPIFLAAGAYFINANALTMPAGLNFYDGELPIKGAGRDTTTLICIGATAFKPGSVGNVSVTLTQGSSTVACAGILAAHQGCGISGTNIPKGAQVGTVTPGVSFVMTNALTPSVGGQQLAAFASATITVALQQRIPKLNLSDLAIHGNFLGSPNGCGGARSSGAGQLQAFPFPYQSQVMPCYPGLADGNAGTNNARNDASCTFNGTTTVLDASIKSEDAGSTVTNATYIPANTTIVSVSPGVSFVMSNAASGSASGQTVAVQLYGTSTATSTTQLTDANASWVTNQWVGALVFVDEDKASNSATAFAGAGYMYVTGNDATHLNGLGFIPTRGGGTYTPSGAAVRYRIHGNTYLSDLHVAERVRFIGPRGFLASSDHGGWHVIKCIVDASGQPNDAGHNDTWAGGLGTVYILDDVLFDGGQGNYVDISAIIPGLFGRLIMKGCRSRNRYNGGVFAAGVGSVINSNGLENASLSGIGYDASTHEANRGNNLAMGNAATSVNVNGSGLTSARNDRVVGNVASDSPLGVMASPPAVPATGVALKNATVACDCTVIITAGAGSTTVVVINGTTAMTIAASAVGTVRVPAGTSIALTYTSAPTWVWIGD